MNHVEKMLFELSLHFSSRQLQGEQGAVAWAKTWVRAFGKHQPWELEAATQRIIETREERTFPIVADVHKAIREIRDLERRSNPKMKVAPEEQQADPFALADTLINCEMGRAAARAEPCWLLALHDFCRENRRLPLDGEIPKLKRIAAEFEANYRLCVGGEAGAFSKGLEALGASMIRRREALRARLLGREAA